MQDAVDHDGLGAGFVDNLVRSQRMKANVARRDVLPPVTDAGIARENFEQVKQLVFRALRDSRASLGCELVENSGDVAQRRRGKAILGHDALLASAAFGKNAAGLFRSIRFAASGRGEALFNAVVDGLAVFAHPVALGIEQVERLRDDLIRRSKMPALHLALDALLRRGIEADRHGQSIARG